MGAAAHSVAGSVYDSVYVSRPSRVFHLFLAGVAYVPPESDLQQDVDADRPGPCIATTGTTPVAAAIVDVFVLVSPPDNELYVGLRDLKLARRRRANPKRCHLEEPEHAIGEELPRLVERDAVKRGAFDVTLG